jgi:hypothetical protein
MTHATASHRGQWRFTHFRQEWAGATEALDVDGVISESLFSVRFPSPGKGGTGNGAVARHGDGKESIIGN